MGIARSVRLDNLSLSFQPTKPQPNRLLCTKFETGCDPNRRRGRQVEVLLFKDQMDRIGGASNAWSHYAVCSMAFCAVTTWKWNISRFTVQSSGPLYLYKYKGQQPSQQCTSALSRSSAEECTISSSVFPNGCGCRTIDCIATRRIHPQQVIKHVKPGVRRSR